MAHATTASEPTAGCRCVRLASASVTVVMPSEPEDETPEDPLEVIGFKDVTVPIEHPARARTEVRVTFALSRPPSAREVVESSRVVYDR